MVVSMNNIITALLLSFIISSPRWASASNLDGAEQSSDSYGVERLFASRYPFHYRYTHIFDSSPTKVWPLFLDIQEWVNRFRIEVSDGESAMKTGAVSKFYPLYGPYQNDPNMFYVMKVVSVVPEQSVLAFMTLSTAMDPKGHVSQFYYWTLDHEQAGTRLTVEAFGERHDEGKNSWVGGIDSYPDESWPAYVKELEKILIDKGL